MRLGVKRFFVEKAKEKILTVMKMMMSLGILQAVHFVSITRWKEPGRNECDEKNENILEVIDKLVEVGREKYLYVIDSGSMANRISKRA